MHCQPEFWKGEMKQAGAVAGAFGEGSTSLPEMRHFSISETLQLWLSLRRFTLDLFHNQFHLL